VCLVLAKRPDTGVPLLAIGSNDQFGNLLGLNEAKRFAGEMPVR